MKTYIIKVKGHQYRVKTGDVIQTEKVEGKVGTTITLDNILLAKEASKKIGIGTPSLVDIKLKAKIIEQFKDKKIEIVKFKKKNRYLKRQGHRQLQTKLKILSA